MSTICSSSLLFHQVVVSEPSEHQHMGSSRGTSNIIFLSWRCLIEFLSRMPSCLHCWTSQVLTSSTILPLSKSRSWFKRRHTYCFKVSGKSWLAFGRRMGSLSCLLFPSSCFTTFLTLIFSKGAISCARASKGWEVNYNAPAYPDILSGELKASCKQYLCLNSRNICIIFLH